jgi:hypothetical protein
MAIYHIFVVFRPVATVLSRKKSYDHSPSKSSFIPPAEPELGRTVSKCGKNSPKKLTLPCGKILIEPAGVGVWTLSHVVMAHCIDLAFHREAGAPSEPELGRTVSKCGKNSPKKLTLPCGKIWRANDHNFSSDLD